jgi:hypothetical protein
MDGAKHRSPGARIKKWNNKRGQAILALQKQLDRLRCDHERLEKERNTLSLYDDVLDGVCLAADLALALIGTSNTSRLLPDLPFEALLGTFLTAAEVYKPWVPNEATHGCAQRIVSGSLSDKDLTGPAHKTLCNRHSLSLLHVSLLCLRYDPKVLHETESILAAGPAATVQHYRAGQSVLAKLLQQADPESGALAASCLHQIAGTVIASCNFYYSVWLLHPEVMYRAVATGQAQCPSDTALDIATDKVAPTPQQLHQIIQGLQYYQGLQAPYAKQKSEITAKIYQLLPGFNGPAEALISSYLGGPWKAASSCSTGPASQSRDPLAAFGDVSTHSTLLSLTAELRGVQSKLSWLDLCSCAYFAGQFSWLQLATFVVSMYPHRPSLLPWARRLVTRTSLTLPMKVLDSYPEQPLARTTAAAAAAEGAEPRRAHPQVKQRQQKEGQEEPPSSNGTASAQMGSAGGGKAWGNSSRGTVKEQQPWGVQQQEKHPQQQQQQHHKPAQAVENLSGQVNGRSMHLQQAVGESTAAEWIADCERRLDSLLGVDGDNMLSEEQVQQISSCLEVVLEPGQTLQQEQQQQQHWEKFLGEGWAEQHVSPSAAAASRGGEQLA